MNDKKLAVVTGASSGIGAATAVALAKSGFDVLLGARRVDRLRAVAEPIGARFQQLDVTDPSSVQAFVDPIDRLDLLEDPRFRDRGARRANAPALIRILDKVFIRKEIAFSIALP